MTIDTRFLLFDFGGTLDADGVRACLRFYAPYRRAGGALDRATFEAVFRESDRRLAALPGIRSAGFRATVAAQVSLLRAMLPDPAAIAGSGEAFAADVEASAANNREMLARLAARHRIGIVSNFTGNLRACLDELGLLPFVSTVADSGVIGVEKPHPAIFRAALDALGATADRAWMIGDNPEADLRPAAALGMKTCWLAPGDAAPPPGIAPTARVHRLADAERLWS
jgi:putative hydrolase of the HAD superfamily